MKQRNFDQITILRRKRKRSMAPTVLVIWLPLSMQRKIQRSKEQKRIFFITVLSIIWFRHLTPSSTKDSSTSKKLPTNAGAQIVVTPATNVAPTSGFRDVFTSKLNKIKDKLKGKSIREGTKE